MLGTKKTLTKQMKFLTECKTNSQENYPTGLFNRIQKSWLKKKDHKAYPQLRLNKPISNHCRKKICSLNQIYKMLTPQT